ncbi:farnesyl-diphosphate synthase [Rhodanobacter sp. 115]|nr:farnesyl-diphosphate synthase [Rhodanobacter sp. 115]
MNPNAELGPALQALITRAEQALDRMLPAEDRSPPELHRAMRYAVLGGGKRLRPLLVYAAGHALGHDGPELDAPACAVELIHAYSLVHDDLPAMDDDDLRRGRPTCHVVFGEAMAILAGDALQALASRFLPMTAPTRRVAWPCCAYSAPPAVPRAWPVARRWTWPRSGASSAWPNWNTCTPARLAH